MDGEESKAKAPSVIPPESLALNPNFGYLQKMIEDNPYKAFVVIHATLQSQMRFALCYDKRERLRGDDFGKKWRLLGTYQYFGQLTKICFITGLIDSKLFDRLNTFNRDRNDLIGHIDPRATEDISDDQVKRICEQGLELVKELRARIMDVLFGRVDKKE
jgi:hypothetical protein